MAQPGEPVTVKQDSVSNARTFSTKTLEGRWPVCGASPFCSTVMGAVAIVTVAQQLCTHFTASIFQGQSNWDGAAGHEAESNGAVFTAP